MHWFDSVDSTNTAAKRMAQNGAPHGTVLVAATQTGGRGRLGRSFSSCEGKGVYLSVIVRPQVRPETLMHLTCAAAVAMCEAVDACTGIQPAIKWVNDLILHGKKLGGILTELSVHQKTGLVDYAVIGIGINCCHKKKDFPPSLQQTATSLYMASGKQLPCDRLAAAMIFSLWKMDSRLHEKKAIIDAYRKNCITLNKQICILEGDKKQYATAVDIDEDGGLIVQYENEQCQTLNTGEVSIRGMYGYV